MSLKVITPVGISLFENYKKKRDDITKDYETIEDCDCYEYERPLHDRWEGHKAERKAITRSLPKWARKHLRANASAEITSILAILERKQQNLTVYLLASETIVSRLAAEILSEVLQGIRDERSGHTVTVAPFDPQLDVIEGLQVTQESRFQEIGLHKLVDRIDVISQKRYDDVLLNITGGFKACLPYLTLMAQIFDIHQYYAFEDTDQLIHIPKLPVQFDWSTAEHYYPYLSNLTLLNQEPELVEELKAQNLVQTKASGKAFATVIGKLYKEFVERNLPTAKHVFGHIMEYKLLEYYLNYPYQQNPAFQAVQRGMDWEPPDPIEVDLLLGDSKGGTNFIIVESKSFLLLKRHFEHVKSRIQRHIDKFLALGKSPSEYHLCIHYQSHSQAKDWMKDSLKPNFLDLQSLFDAVPGCRFKVFFVYIDFTDDGKPSYQRFIAQPFESTRVEEYQL